MKWTADKYNGEYDHRGYTGLEEFSHTGWIDEVVEYAKCGSHMPRWKSQAHFDLVLAAPELAAALAETDHPMAKEAKRLLKGLVR